MKLILTGATGVAGAEILRTALLDPSINHVTVISRRAPPQESLPPTFSEGTALQSKYTFIKHDNFLAYPPSLIEKVRDHNAVIWALGKTTRGTPKDVYEALTHDFPVAALKAFTEAGVGRNADGKKGLQFVYVSGNGADSSEKSLILFARVKGRTENDLRKYASLKSTPEYPITTYNIRPGYFFPTNVYEAKALRSNWERIIDRPLRGALNILMPGTGHIPVDKLAKASIRIAKGAVSGDVFENSDLIEVAKEAE